MRYALIAVLLLASCAPRQQSAAPVGYAPVYNPDPYGLGAASRDFNNAADSFRNRRTYVPVQPQPNYFSPRTTCTTFGTTTTRSTSPY